MSEKQSFRHVMDISIPAALLKACGARPGEEPAVMSALSTWGLVPRGDEGDSAERPLPERALESQI